MILIYVWDTQAKNMNYPISIPRWFNYIIGPTVFLLFALILHPACGVVLE